MANSDFGTKTEPVKTDTSMLYGQKPVGNSYPQLDLPIVKYSSLVEDLQKSRKKLNGYLEKIRYSESEKARAEIELSKAKKSVEELTLLIESSNRGLKFPGNGNYAEVMRDLVDVKEEVIRLKFNVDSVLSERVGMEKEAEELRFKTEGNSRLLESLKKAIKAAHEERFLVELRKIEALKECKEIEKSKEGKWIEVSGLLVEKNKRIEEIIEEAVRSKEIENELFETSSDVEMLETQLKLVKKMERRVQRSMSRSNRSFESFSVLKEATKARNEEFACVKAELFELMAVMDTLRNEILQAKEETARVEKHLRRDHDVKIQKLNSKMLMAKSKVELVLSAKERISSLGDSLASSLAKLKRNRDYAKKEECFLKEEKTVTKAETRRIKLEIDEKVEREMILKLDELEKAKNTEALVLEKLEALIEDTMETREIESEHCSTITISRFEYEYLSKHGYQAEEAAGKKIEAAEAWIEAIKASTKAVLMKTETLMREREWNSESVRR